MENLDTDITSQGRYFMRAPLPTYKNPLLACDVYKMGHMVQYASGTEAVFSYMTSRSDRVLDRMVFFGLQYYLEQYLTTPLELWMAEEFIRVRRAILGKDNEEVNAKIRALCRLGYWPVKIKAVPEGTVLDAKNVVMTIRSTKPGFHWCVGFIESLLLKVWFPINVASISYKYRRELERRFARTCPEDRAGILFHVHDFGYRGDSSEESACISGAAHLTSFSGSDTVPAFKFVEQFYNTGKPYNGLLMASVPASEHSVMCSYGRDGELEAFQTMLDQNPNSIVSIVSDTYNLWTVLTDYVDVLYPQIMARPDGAKVVFRPDSGDPIKIICGDPEAPDGHPERLGVLSLLGLKFGYTVNEQGFKVLNPKVGMIYGDGMHFDRWTAILDEMERRGWAASNLVIGIGGILRYHTRDTLGFALKATQITKSDGTAMDIMKDPITDHGKKSHKGLVGLFNDVDKNPYTQDQLTNEEEADACNLLVPVYENGLLLQQTSFDLVRRRVEAGLRKELK
jgi:nicotinamide phosphoribosyltransferase